MDNVLLEALDINESSQRFECGCNICYNHFMKSYSFTSDLKNIRRHLGLSQEETARELGLSRVSISRFETGQEEPGALALEKFYSCC